VEGLTDGCDLCERECTGACQPDGVPLPVGGHSHTHDHPHDHAPGAGHDHHHAPYPHADHPLGPRTLRQSI